MPLTTDQKVKTRFDHSSTLPRAKALRAEGKSVVYFLAGAGLIKIGVTTNPTSRLRSIRNSSPVPLETLYLHDGNLFTEMLVHGRLAAYRRHGEWFEDCAPVRDLMEAMRSGRYDLSPRS